MIPRFMRGNFCIGPNGFFKYDGYDPIQSYFSIHWFSATGLVIQKIEMGKTVYYKIKFRKIAKFFLRRRLDKADKLRLREIERRQRLYEESRRWLRETEQK